jgi:hypothetical protein
MAFETITTNQTTTYEVDDTDIVTLFEGVTLATVSVRGMNSRQFRM